MLAYGDSHEALYLPLDNIWFQERCMLSETVRQFYEEVTEKELLAQTGADPQNPTFDLPCREVFARGQKEIEVVGPFPELVKEIAEVHKGYWNN